MLSNRYVTKSRSVGEGEIGVEGSGVNELQRIQENSGTENVIIAMIVSWIYILYINLSVLRIYITYTSIKLYF